MAQLVLLGTGAALAGADRENSYLLVRGPKTTLMIDCAGAPAQRMARLGLSLDNVDHLILTHHHPDHIYGYPMFVLDAWLQGRTRLLPVYALEPTIESAKMLLAAAEAETWPKLFPIVYNTVSPKSIEMILTTSDLTVSATMGEHFIPTLALRITARQSGNTVTYTSDTTPTEQIVELARNTDLLVHEATALKGTSAGHSTAVQAGIQARAAHAKKLVLMHVPPDCDPKKWREAAKREFRGPVRVARDFDFFEF